MRDSVLAEQFLKFKEGLGSQPLTAPFSTDTDNGSLPSFVQAMEVIKDGKASVLDVFNWAPSVIICDCNADYIVTLYGLRRLSGRPPDYT